MTGLRCPLCDSVLLVPADVAEPGQILEALAGHFSEACPAVPTLRRPKLP